MIGNRAAGVAAACIRSLAADRVPPSSRAVLGSLTCLTALLLAACDPWDAPAQQAAGSPAAGAVAEPDTSGPVRVALGGVNLTGIGYDLGSVEAPIVIVEFSDFGCPYCGQYALETFPAIDREYIQDGKVFYKHVPFVMGRFPNGEKAARAAECAGEQGQFWPMHDMIYEHQNDWKRGTDADALFARLAGQAMLDGTRWGSCYANDRQAARTSAANSAASRLNIRATPTFFINGQLVEGALPLGVLRGGLNSLLQAAGP